MLVVAAAAVAVVAAVVAVTATPMAGAVPAYVSWPVPVTIGTVVVALVGMAWRAGQSLATKADIQATKADIQAAKADIQAAKADIQRLDGKIDRLASEVSGIARDLAFLAGREQGRRDTAGPPDGT